MGVAPGCQGRFVPEVFVADVEPAEKAAFAIDHHYLAVVAKIQLEAVEQSAAGGEGMDLDAAGAHFLAEMARQGVAADAVIEHENLHAGGRALQQQVLQTLAEAVVADDEELQQYYFARAGQGTEDRGEGRFAIDQQLHLIVRQAGHQAQPRQGTQLLVDR